MSQWDYRNQYPRPSRQTRRRSRKGLAFLGCGGLGALVVLIAALAASHGSGSPSAGAAATVTASAAASASESAAAASCAGRPAASGDIIVRTLAPGSGWTAQELGGEWGWDWTTGQCLTSVQVTIATAPSAAGSCTEVGYVKDNPGYDVNAVPAARLAVVAAQAGPAC